MRKENGSMLLETVIVMPFLAALVFGALQMAHIHAARQVVSYAAYAAARAVLPAENGKEKEEAEKAARRVLCFLAASPDSMHDGVMMPDPEAQAVKGRILSLNVKQDSWSREVDLKFAFPLVIPLAAQILAYQFDLSDYSTKQPGSHISTASFGDAFTGPHLIFHERIRLPKPYIVKN